MMIALPIWRTSLSCVSANASKKAFASSSYAWEMALPWRSLPCTLSQVRLEVVLTAGQSFRWRETREKEWTSVLLGKVWRLKQDSTGIQYQVFEPETKNANELQENQSKYLDSERNSEKTSKRTNKVEKLGDDGTQDSVANKEEYVSVSNYEHVLRDYLQLDVDLEDLYKEWCKSDPNFSKVAQSFTGIRTLRQDPVENLFSFICSSNNNIPRITSMVEKMCVKYGEKLMQIDGVDYYSFPAVAELAGKNVEHELRAAGFGYRAKFISQSAQAILRNGGEQWLYSLRNENYQEAHSALCKLPGVGSKVADCVCLMSLDKSDAIPVDTHVWQITTKYYMPNLTKNKSLTDKLYLQIGDHYRKLFGRYAGWAHSVLFCADLKKFQELHTTSSAVIEKSPAKPKKRASPQKSTEKIPKKKAKPPSRKTNK